MRFLTRFCLFAACLGAGLVIFVSPATAQQPVTAQSVARSSKISVVELPPAPVPMTVDISGTVTDDNGDLVPGAQVVVQGAQSTDRHSVVADDNGAFDLPNLTPGISYHVKISAQGFSTWSTTTPVLAPGSFYFVTGIKLRLTVAATSVTVTASPREIAVAQVHLEEQQRVLGFIPNFYVVYDSQHAVPMTTRLKFQMAFRVLVDPVNFLGTGFIAGVNQAASTPNYVEGVKGYGERFGAVYADGFTDLMFGGAILPSLLHQDPRYFYQGTGTTGSRLLHALSYPFICKGDDGHWQPNYSSVGGDLASAALSNAYYPPSNRGATLVFENLGINTGERAISSVIQEFVLRRFTPSASHHK
jgi:hypothetical protein